MRRQVLKAAAVASFVLAAFVGACSLGLDASKLDVLGEAGSDVTVDVVAEADVPPGTTRCTKDTECGDQQCYSGKCLGGLCKIELCPTTGFVCKHSACTGTKCSEPVRHSFAATTMTLGQAGLFCENAIETCVAVVYPFAFLRPKTGDAVAYPIVDFVDGGASPAPVKLQGIAFTVTRIVASGDRVWFLGDHQLIGSTALIPVAWIDVPTDPSLKTLVAFTGTLTLPSKDSSIAGALPGADRGLLVALTEPNAAAPMLVTQLKVLDNALSPANNVFNTLPGYDGGAKIVASSGDRLITARSLAPPPMARYDIDIIRNAGAANPVALGARDLTSALGPKAVYDPVTFASTPAGGVLAQAAIAQLEVVDGGPSVVGVDSVVVGWFLQQADDSTVQSKGFGKVLLFPEAGVPAPEVGLVGPIAAIGEDKAIALQLLGDSGTSVRVVLRDGGVPPSSQGTLALRPSEYMIRGARSEVTGKEYAYAFSRPNSDAEGVKLTVFELDCGP